MGSPVVHWEFLSKQPAKIASFYETFSLFADPDGRMMGLWKANQ